MPKEDKLTCALCTRELFKPTLINYKGKTYCCYCLNEALKADLMYKEQPKKQDVV